jgi:NADH:ubiquinone oxidoreductase subunit 6 (subunit J)
MLGSILAVYMLCSFIYAKRYENAEKNNISFKPAVLAVLLVLFIQISYSVYYNYNTLKADADRKADIAKYLDKDTLGTVKKPPLGIYLLKGNPRNERLKGNFTNEVLIERTKLYFNTINKSVINNNRAMAAIIMIILLFAALLKFAKGSLRNTIKKNLILMCIIFTLYFIGFYFTLLVEPWANSSAWRYISSALNMFLPAGYYYFAVIFSGGMIRQKTSYAALDIEKTKNNIFYAAYIIFVSAMLFSHINISSQIKKYKTQYNNETALQMDKEIKTIKPFINPNDRVLLIIHTKADTLDYHKCKYFSYYFVLPSISKVLPHPADKDIKQLEKFIQDSAIKFRASKLIIWRPLELIDTKNLDEKFKDGYSALLPVSRHKELPWIFEISVNKGSLTFTLIN